MSLRTSLRSSVALGRRGARRVRRALQSLPRPGGRPAAAGDYQATYEAHALAHGDDGVGGGDYELIGEIELALLRDAGLAPGMTLIDFGCGNGRLAVHAVPFLGSAGRYVGIDISPTFIRHAEARIGRLTEPRATVELHVQADTEFPVAEGTADMVCAFSVFTHMEHEDMYRYLRALRPVLRSGGTVVLSVLPLDLAAARDVFLAECGFDPVARWQRVRNVVTSRELVGQVAELAGWRVAAWLPGDAPQVVVGEDDERSLGQTVAVLERID